jgi:cytochrome c553
MFKKLMHSIFCAAAISAVVAVPATAADDIGTRVQVCSGCHGETGAPVNATTPVVWGQQANYLYKELHDYHSGDRTNAIMASIAQGFTLPDLRQVANYFAAKTWPAQHAADASATPPEGTAVCRACHGQNFEGGAPAPRLAGLSYEYLIAAMNAFADGERTNNLDMPVLMKALSESQRDAIAHYLAGL